MGKNHSSIVVLRIWPKFWWMLLVGVKDNHTSMSPKFNGGGREQALQVPELHFKISNFGLKISLCFPQAPLELAQNGQTKENSGCSRHATRIPCLRALQLHNMPANGPQKGPQKPQNLCTLATDGPKPKGDHILGYVAQNAISSAPHTPQSPNFAVTTPQNCPNRHLDPRSSGPMGCGKLQEVPQRGGLQNWSTGCTGYKIFFKNDPGPHGMPQRQQFWLVLSSWWSVLEMGCFGIHDGSKMSQKCVFPKMILDHFMCRTK